MLGRSSVLFALVCVGAVQLVACGGGSGGTGAAGSTGTAGSGTQGAAGASAGSTGSGQAGVGHAGGSTAGTSGAAGNTLTGIGGSGSGAAGATGGSTGTAGSGVAGSGAAGSGAAGSGAGGSTQPKMSAGCGKDPTDAPGKWNQHNIMVTKVAAAYTANYTNRTYWTRVPSGYDNSKPMNLILWGQGCGQGGTAESVPPNENPQASAASIIVELLAPQVNNHCYYAGPDGDKADSPEIPYFDQVVSEVEAQFCIDTSKVFEGGYSSGGWEASLISCVRTNVLRGTGWAAAGLQFNHDTCTGPVAALITVDKGDNGTPQGQAMMAVENIRMRNGCATTSTPWNPVWPAGAEKANISSCVLYDNCMPGYPLVWCQTTFGMHTNTEGDTHLTKDGLWELWSTLPF